MPRKIFIQKPSHTTLLIAALLVLLAVLATLQYRWLGRVSAGERELMRENLKMKSSSFCEEFDREITRAYAAFKMDADDLSDENRNAKYAARFDRWIKTSPHPGIVKSVFLVETNGAGGRLRLSRFDRTKGAFEPGEWTPESENLRRRFEQQNSDAEESANVFNGGADSIVEEIPALVSSIASVKTIDAENNHRQIDWQHPLGYVVVALDLDYIKREFFPALVKSHFASGETLDYNLVVTSRNLPERLIYQSNSESDGAEKLLAATAVEGKADASDKLFNISFDKVKSFSSERVSNSAPASDKSGSNFTLVIPALEDDKTDGKGDNDSDKLLLVDDSARWELKVNHRSGSLEAAVERARRWNLAASFGILLLLAVNIIMISALTRRSQKLARRQIEFVAGVSHEFRNPLAVIYSLSENLAAGRLKTAARSSFTARRFTKTCVA